MAQPDDELDPQGGGFGDWMSGLAPILGAAASFRSPAAGAALFGIGDYMRRQRMAELAAQRQQRTQALQQQRDAATRQHFQGLGFDIPEGMSAVDAYKAMNDQRTRQRDDLLQARRDRSQQAVAGATGIGSSMMQGLPSDAMGQLQQLSKDVGADQWSSFGPVFKEAQDAQAREFAASEQLPGSDRAGRA